MVKIPRPRILEDQFRQYFPKRVKGYKSLINIFKATSGLEIGGPSMAFSKKGFLPLYDDVGSLDGCNFSTNTVWEGKIKEGPYFKYGNRKGWQYIKDAVDLSGIENNKYDFILSCHSIEHIANPIKALMEWKRVLKNNGVMLIIVPHKDGTFDRKRPITTLEHLISDYNNETTEDDETHFSEVISLHDMNLDPGSTIIDSFIERTRNNSENRCIHHHVFNTPLLIDLIDYCGFKIDEISFFNPFHIILFASKPNDKPENSLWKQKNAHFYKKSPFPSDIL